MENTHNIIAEILLGEMILKSLFSNFHHLARIYQNYFTGAYWYFNGFVPYSKNVMFKGKRWSSSQEVQHFTLSILMKHYSSICTKTVGRGEENRKFRLCIMATAQMSECLYCLVLVSSCPPIAVFTAYCTWIRQPWGHRVSWNTLANIRKSQDEKKKS